MFGNFKRDININRARMAKLQSDLSSGRNVRVPSHGPIKFERSRIIDENMRKEEQFQNNIENGQRQGRMAQESLDQILDRVVDVKRILVQGSTETVNEDSRQNFAQEIGGIRDSIIDSLNSSYNNRFLFAGTISDAPPFEYDPATANAGEGAVVYNGNDKTPQVLVADGIQLGMSVSGEDVRTIDAGTDFFQIIKDIEDAFLADDTTALNDLMQSVDQAVDHLTKITSALGNNLNRMDYMFEEYESRNITQNADKSSLIDTDYAEGFSDLQRTQLAFEAAMAVHSSMFNNSLLHYL